MTTSLFIRTFARDLEWFRYCVRGVQRQCRGFAEIVVHVDTAELELFRPLVPADWRLVHSAPRSPVGYIDQQLVKLRADEWCTGDMICFVDPDCIFFDRTRPEDLVQDGRIVLLFEPYATLAERTPWQAPTQEILGGTVDHEFMRRFTLTYWRDTLSGLRDWLTAARGGRPALETLAKIKRLSEFNVLGAWAWRHQPERYCWLRTTVDPLPPLRLVQFWSHGGVDRNRGAIEELLER